jgi:ABC-type glycerol-3-phosphate transport system substrate-binding protein
MRLAHLWLISVLLVLAGCSPQAPTSWPTNAPRQNPAIAQEAITLRVWLAADYVDQAPIRDLVTDFKQAYPNIDIELTGYVWEELAAKMRLAIAQGNPPDVGHQHAFAMAAQGMAEPVDDLWEAWGAVEEFMPGALSDVTWKGQKYGVPLDINALFTIYNRAAFAEAGLQPPQKGYTFAQLESDLRKLTPPDQSRYGIALSASGWDMYGLIRANGGELLDENQDGVRVSLNAPRVVETVRFFADLGSELFSQRKVAMFFSGPWDLVRLKNEAPPEVFAEIGTAPLPVATAGAPEASVQGGGSLFVPKGAAHREAAFEFMKWAVSDRYALRMTKEMGRYPVRSAVYQDPFFQNEPLLLPFLDQLKTARPYRLEAYAIASDIWSDAIHDALTPGANVEAILESAQQGAQEVLGIAP